ncbi:MAG: sodium:alanine symporter family protein [Candidatus Margulisbacteria bacterium]|nr:sodium:alanine symporter family protein [Candidatus Margulisiibacteriota bacterium]
MDISISGLIESAVGFVWNKPVIILCLVTGIFFTLRLGFIQFRCFKHAISLIRGHYDNPNEKGQITHFQALCAALSGTIGLGNIAGVAIAIKIGGPGAIFWMWVVGILGMATKYAECGLGTYFRDVDPETGEVSGGPMHYITKGLGQKWKPMALFYAFCALMGSFGAGNMFQSNQAAEALQSSFSIPPVSTGIVLTILVGIVIIGGIKRIGKVASRIVPFMCGIYILGAIIICVMNIQSLPQILTLIVTDAFTGNAAAGGAFGTVLIWGVRRAIFSNEAGLGSAAIAHAAVKTDYPIREGIVASLGPLIDTIIVCSATAFVIIISGNYGPMAMGNGISLTTASFDMFLDGFGSIFISLAVFFFAFSTMITWSYYGERAATYLFGKKFIMPYRMIFVMCVFLGAIVQLSDVLNFADLMIGLMVIPNSIAIILLSPKVVALTKDYFTKLKAGEYPRYK